MSRNTEAYQCYMSCLGNLCGFFCCTCRKVETSSLGLKESFGKFVQLLHPGLHYFNPFTEEIRTMSLKTTVVDMRDQAVYTKDNIRISIDTALFYRIIDPCRARYTVKDVTQSLMEMTYVTMRAICGEYILQDLLVKRIEVNEKIAAHITQNTEHWGVYIEHLILKDMRLSPQLSSNLSQVSKTRRAVESQIISAKADLESAKLYREASDILEIKAAIQIRFLETLENMNAMPSGKITVIPLKPDYDLQSK